MQIGGNDGLVSDRSRGVVRNARTLGGDVMDTPAVTGDGYAIRLNTKYFYCQPDGGQWNVVVYVKHVHATNICLIAGNELKGTCSNAAEPHTEFMAVDSYNLYCNLQD